MADSSAPLSSVQIALVGFFCVCVFLLFVFVVFLKKDSVLSLSQDILKTPAKAITRS